MSDGTQTGTFVLEQFTGTASGPPINNITSFGNGGVYSVITDDGKLQLHKTDGTYDGTSTVYNFGDYKNYSVSYFKTIDSLIYFELNNNTTKNNEIWRTDGTTAGTYQVKDLGKDYGFASDFMSFKNDIYFITISSTYGDYIWKSDGTTAGTAPLQQISKTFQSDNFFPSYASVENSMILANNVLYFTANDGTHGKELWKTDGTAAGTVMTFDFNPGSAGSNPNGLTVLNNEVYFSVNTAVFPVGNELYKYNGSQFSQPIDIFAGANSGNPSNLTIQNNTLLFTAANQMGSEFWISDGTAANTVEIADIVTGPVSSVPSLITVQGNAAYFTAFSDVNGDGIANEPCVFKYSAPDKIWTGSVSNDSQDGTNWFPSGVPSFGNNVLLPVNPANSFSNPSLFCNDFINNGSTVNVGNGLVFIEGNFFNAGTINNPTVNGFSNGVFGIVASVGSNVTHLAGNTGKYIGQLTLSGGSNMQLTTNAYFPTLRVEGADSVYLGDYSFTVDNYNINKPTIITNGAGKLFMPVGSSPVTFNFTNPVTITNNGAPDYFGVSVKDGVLKNGFDGDTVKTQAVNKTWDISKQTAGAANANITLQWNAADELPGFDRSHVYLNHFTNGKWDAGNIASLSGSGPFTVTRNNITSFSPFSISSSTSALPVTLVGFEGEKINKTVSLSWQTSSEQNTSYFSIERSADGIKFESIGKVNAAGNSSERKDYSFTDNEPLTGNNFYRLKTMDKDEKYFFSKIICVANNSNSSFKVYPNPAQDILYLQLPQTTENTTISIYDANGRKVKEFALLQGANTSINISSFSKGVYNLILKSKTKTYQQKFIKE